MSKKRPNAKQKLEASEYKQSLIIGNCPVCGKRSRNMQLAHIIPKPYSKYKEIMRYLQKMKCDIDGWEIIHHKNNLLPVCSLQCNSSVQISNPEPTKRWLRFLVNNFEGALTKQEVYKTLCDI